MGGGGENTPHVDMLHSFAGVYVCIATRGRARPCESPKCPPKGPSQVLADPLEGGQKITKPLKLGWQV